MGVGIGLLVVGEMVGEETGGLGGVACAGAASCKVLGKIAIVLSGAAEMGGGFPFHHVAMGVHDSHALNHFLRAGIKRG